jgi:hypothetical protein
MDLTASAASRLKRMRNAPRLFLLALALPAFSQPIVIQCGSPTDQYFVGGVGAWKMPLAPPLAFLRYGTPNMSYVFTLPNGIYNVTLVMAEPNKTAANQRVFTVAANGQTSAPLDLFALTGGDNIPYTLQLNGVVVAGQAGAGLLKLPFAATAGNAVASLIMISPAPSVAPVLGGPCTAPAAGVTLYAQLPDKSCLPIVPIAQPGKTASIQQISSGSLDYRISIQPSESFQVVFIAINPGGGSGISTPIIVKAPPEDIQ